jgi:hypothetical protein
MRYNRRTEPDHSAIMNLHAFGIFIFKVNVIADKYSAADFNAAQPMKKRP